MRYAHASVPQPAKAVACSSKGWAESHILEIALHLTTRPAQYLLPHPGQHQALQLMGDLGLGQLVHGHDLLGIHAGDNGILLRLSTART